MTEPLTKAEMVSRYKAARRNLWSGRFVENECRPERDDRATPERAIALARMRNQKIEAELVAKRQAKIAETIAAKKNSEIISRAVIEAVAITAGISAREVTGESRSYSITRWRHIAIFLVKQRLPALSYDSVGRLFNREHSTILHSIDRAKEPSMAGDVARVQAVLGGGIFIDRTRGVVLP